VVGSPRRILRRMSFVDLLADVASRNPPLHCRSLRASQRHSAARESPRRAGTPPDDNSPARSAPRVEIEQIERVQEQQDAEMISTTAARNLVVTAPATPQAKPVDESSAMAPAAAVTTRFRWPPGC